MDYVSLKELIDFLEYGTNLHIGVLFSEATEMKSVLWKTTEKFTSESSAKSLRPTESMALKDVSDAEILLLKKLSPKGWISEGFA